MVFLWTPRYTLHLSKISSALGTWMKALSLGTTSSISGSLLFSLLSFVFIAFLFTPHPPLLPLRLGSSHVFIALWFNSNCLGFVSES